MDWTHSIITELETGEEELPDAPKELNDEDYDNQRESSY